MLSKVEAGNMKVISGNCLQSFLQKKRDKFTDLKKRRAESMENHSQMEDEVLEMCTFWDSMPNKLEIALFIGVITARQMHYQELLASSEIEKSLSYIDENHEFEKALDKMYKQIYEEDKELQKRIVNIRYRLSLHNPCLIDENMEVMQQKFRDKLQIIADKRQQIQSKIGKFDSNLNLIELGDSSHQIINLVVTCQSKIRQLASSNKQMQYFLKMYPTVNSAQPSPQQ